jgi:hypothetical protein
MRLISNATSMGDSCSVIRAAVFRGKHSVLDAIYRSGWQGVASHRISLSVILHDFP